MTSIRSAPIAAASLVLALGAAGQALAWGSSGHRMVTQAAIEALPPELPAFMRSPAFARDAAETAREPDRLRRAGRTRDNEYDPAHFVDADDTGKVMGGPALTALPATREEYETALRAIGADSWKAGYLPYRIIDGWQLLVKDLATWRADAAGVRLTADPSKKAWLAEDLKRREGLILTDLGLWSHFVGDAAYPPHVSWQHYDGWGRGPNPNGYTTERIHVPLEGPYVAANVTLAQVKAKLAPFHDCQCAIEARTGQYLAASVPQVDALFALEKAGGFRPGDARGPAFMTGRIAVAAGELRDLIVLAWRASGAMTVGYPQALPATDFEAGKVADPYAALHSTD
jgi:hypothetical protein